MHRIGIASTLNLHGIGATLIGVALGAVEMDHDPFPHSDSGFISESIWPTNNFCIGSDGAALTQHQFAGLLHHGAGSADDRVDLRFRPLDEKRIVHRAADQYSAFC